jgi:hypothetical protein
MEARTLLLGDWSRPVRDPIDLLRVSYVLRGGAVVGAVLLVAWAVYGWGSVRRVPGENRSEEVAA